MLTGPILITDDDEDDQLLIQKMLSELGVYNRIQFFMNGKELLDYLLQTSEQPFLILSDINMPVMDGLELRERINADPGLRNKAIPFVFLSTQQTPELIHRAYELTVQGFFKKAMGYEATKEQLRWIVGYWQTCQHPNNLFGEGGMF